MWEKETCYKFALKRNLIYDFCQNAYKDSSDTDMVSGFQLLRPLIPLKSIKIRQIFITKDNHKVPAHRVILALFSDLFKDLDIPVERLIIHLPDFNRPVVESLVQFLYSGSVVLDLALREVFTSLCNELKISYPEEIIDVPSDIQPEPAPVKIEEEIAEEYDDPEYIEEAIHEEESSDEQEGSSSALQSFTFEPSSSPRKPPEKMTIVSPRSELRPDNRKRALDLSTSSLNLSQPHVHLQEALADIACGLNTMEAARKYGIPKSTLYRWAKKAKVE